MEYSISGLVLSTVFCVTCDSYFETKRRGVCPVCDEEASDE